MECEYEFRLGGVLLERLAVPMIEGGGEDRHAVDVEHRGIAAHPRDAGGRGLQQPCQLGVAAAGAAGVVLTTTPGLSATADPSAPVLPWPHG
ncbi:hypothetical protein [Micromonospora haikouensis]|uniref:hypothetical protein n=1 Tax=Micromonospora haikouensis TaxID=686309 RepID=UPI003D75F9CC